MLESFITLTTCHSYNYLPMPDIVISPAGIANIIEDLTLYLSASHDNINFKVLRVTKHV